MGSGQSSPLQDTSYDFLDLEVDPQELRRRAKAAVLGSFVADAATMPLHWIYSVRAIRQHLESASRDDPEFFDPVVCPFYQYETGNQSPYGDEAFLLLQSLVDHGGFDGPHFTHASYKYFKAYPGRLNHMARALVASIDQGNTWPYAAPNDDQANCLAKVAILVARYGGKPELKTKVVEAVKAHQNNSEAIAMGVAAAQILERVVLGQSVQAALEWAATPGGSLDPHCQRTVAAALGHHGRIPDVLKKLGHHADLPGSFQGALHVASVTDNYAAAIRANIWAGGDNCGRAMYLGALLAAQGGIDAIPEDWHAATFKYVEVEALVDEVLKQRSIIELHYA